MSIIAVCAFFNPFHSESRKRAFGIFRSSLESNGIPVLCVEQVYQGVAQVSCSTDITVSGGDLLWQKECLLQIGIDRVIADGYTKVLICDADIIFESPHCLESINESFSKYDYFQPFESITMEYSDGALVRPSAMSVDSPRPYGSGHPGSCWAASSEFLQKVRLFPYAILGGGDVVMTHLCDAIIEHGSESSRFIDLCVYFTNHVLYRNLNVSLLAWALQFKGTSFRMGHTIGVQLRSLDHGPRIKRMYQERYLPWRGDRANYAPQPKIDFDVCASGLLRWTTHKDEWNMVALKYFRMRDVNISIL